MSILRARGSRGASVLAAVAFVAIFGMVTMVVINISPSPNPRSQMAQAGSTGLSDMGDAGTQTNSQEKIESQCNKGEVHTVREDLSSAGQVGQPMNEIGTGTSGSGKPSETITKCYIPDLAACKTTDPNKCLILKKNPDPKVASDPACDSKIAKVDKCVVRYCPIGCVKQVGTCVVISCAQGDSACLQRGLNATQQNSCVGALAELSVQAKGIEGSNLVAITPDGSVDNTINSLKSNLSPEAFDTVKTQQEITSNNTALANVERQLQACAGTFFDCSGEEQAKLNSDRLALQAMNERLQKTLGTQMQRLNASQTGLSPDTTGSIPTGSGSAYGEQAGVDQYCRDNPKACAQPGITTGGVPAGNTGVPDSRLAGGDIATQATYCVTNLEPVVVKPVQAGSVFPSNCYNDRRLGTYAPPQPSTGFNNSLGGNLGSSLFGNSPASRAASNGLFYQLGSMVGNLISGKGFGGGATQQQMACATTQDQYQQQQQQYNQQIQQYNYTLQQQQYQQQQPQYVVGYDQYGEYIQRVNQPYGSPYGSPYGQSQYVGGNSQYGQQQLPPPQQPPQPCYNNQQPQQCSFSPQKPGIESCTSGTWKSTTSGNGCVSGWQCVPNGASTGGTGGSGTGGTGSGPAATISCEPKIADVGMTIAISYACANATQSAGGGFNTGGALSGSATTTISTPPQNTNTVTYTLTCNKQGTTAGAQCSVQFGKPGIVFLANPGTIKSGGSTTLGWITSGMQSCVVSSPDNASFTAQNAGVSAPNGIATAAGLTTNTRFALNCTTAGGSSAAANTTVTVTPQ